MKPRKPSAEPPPDREDVERLAGVLAARHEEEPVGEGSLGWGTVEALATRVHELAVHARLAGAAEEAVERRRERLVRTLAERADDFRARVMRGRIRRRQLVQPEAGGPDSGLDEKDRFADVCADLAALVADLRRRGAAERAERLLSRYAEASDDYGFFPLLDFYLDVHALERTAAGEEEPEDAAWGPAGPALVATTGLVGCGKSTIARWAAELLVAPRIAADDVRESILEDPPAEPVLGGEWERNCAPGFADSVYAELFRRATFVLRSGRGVVLDGCFRSRAQRATALALADRFAVPFLLVECRLARREHLARLAARDRERGRAPGTWHEILHEMERTWEPPDELPASRRLVLDTARAPDESRAVLAAGLAAALGREPERAAR